jgi:hypothetical protein
MVELIQQAIRSQFEASLSMVKICVESCKPQFWEGKIANDSFKQVAYHTLFYADLYLSCDESSMESRDFHKRGGDERGADLSAGLSREDTLAYIPVCRQKAIEIIGAETQQSLEGPSGFSWRKTSRLELHIYNIRHIQHHIGAMSAYLRRVDESLRDPKAIGWVGQGWK